MRSSTFTQTPTSSAASSVVTTTTLGCPAVRRPSPGPLRGRFGPAPTWRRWTYSTLSLCRHPRRRGVRALSWPLSPLHLPRLLTAPGRRCRLRLTTLLLLLRLFPFWGWRTSLCACAEVALLRLPCVVASIGGDVNRRLSRDLHLLLLHLHLLPTPSASPSASPSRIHRLRGSQSVAPKATVSFYFTSSSLPFYFTPLYSSLLHSTPPYSTLLLLTSPSTLLQYSLLQIPSTLHLPLAIDDIVSLPFLWVPFGSLLTCFVVFIFFITFCIVFLYHNKI